MSENVVALGTVQDRKRKRLETLLEGILTEVRNDEITEFAAVLAYGPTDVTMVSARLDGEDPDLFHVAGLLHYGSQIAGTAATTDYYDEE